MTNTPENYAELYEALRKHKVGFYVVVPADISEECKAELQALGFCVWLDRTTTIVTTEWAAEQSAARMVANAKEGSS